MKKTQDEINERNEKVWRFIYQKSKLFAFIIVALPLIIIISFVLHSIQLFPCGDEVSRLEKQGNDIWNSHIPGTETTVRVSDTNDIFTCTDEDITVKCHGYFFALHGHIEDGKITLLPPSASTMSVELAITYLFIYFLVVLVSILLSFFVKDIVENIASANLQRIFDKQRTNTVKE